jgi:DNA-binding NarL/FixJ family response regulator
MQIAILGLDAHDEPIVLEASSIDEVRALAAREHDLDLLLLDLRMPGMDGFAGLVALRREFPALPVVIVSASEEHKTIREALALGAAGYIPKTLARAEIESALERILRGEIWFPDADGERSPGPADEQEAADRTERIASLTPQQLKVLQLVAQGKPNKIIAYELDIAETTVKAHITVILRKLGVYSRTQAVLVARDFFSTAT